MPLYVQLGGESGKIGLLAPQNDAVSQPKREEEQIAQPETQNRKMVKVNAMYLS
jgi:hypothetical protein